jgi:hypothetical protein
MARISAPASPSSASRRSIDPDAVVFPPSLGRRSTGDGQHPPLQSVIVHGGASDSQTTGSGAESSSPGAVKAPVQLAGAAATATGGGGKRRGGMFGGLRKRKSGGGGEGGEGEGANDEAAGEAEPLVAKVPFSRLLQLNKPEL